MIIMIMMIIIIIIIVIIIIGIVITIVLLCSDNRQHHIELTFIRESPQWAEYSLCLAQCQFAHSLTKKE